MKAFVIAMDNEAQTVIGNLSGAVEERLFGRRVVKGKLNGEDVAVIVSGIGIANAAAATQLALSAFAPDEIYNIGVAGGLDPEMEVGDLYEVESAVQYDFDLTKINGTEFGTLDERDSPYIPFSPKGKHPAKILGSGDRFNDDPDDNALLLRLGAGLRDMEGAAIANVCEKAGVECRSLKCVSDVYGKGATTGQYLEKLAKCMKILTGAVPAYV